MNIQYKSIVKKAASGLLLSSLAISSVFAGNKDRVGQAGGNELLINPWARSSGLASANTANVSGLESMHLNVAGLSFINKTELSFTRTNWLSGSDINLNAFGFAQKLGEKNTLGVAVMSMSFGDIPITTVEQPDGGLGTFSPSLINIGISFARKFSESIYGGITVKAVSQSIADARSNGVAFDTGIRYVTGKTKQIKFGIALRNVGPKLQFAGDGFSTKVTLDDKEITLEQRTAPFELPALLNIGASYDYVIGAKADSTGKMVDPMHKIVFSGSFTSNSFGKDQLHAGAEYGFKEMFFVRAGFLYEEGIFNVDTRTTVYTGPTVGASVHAPFNQGTSNICIDYSYRATNPFGGTHAIGVRVEL